MTTYPAATLTIDGASEEVQDVCCEVGSRLDSIDRGFQRAQSQVTLYFRHLVKVLHRFESQSRRIRKRSRTLAPHWKSQEARHLARIPWFFDLSQYGYRSRDKLPRGVRQNLRHGPPVAMLEWDIGGATPTMRGV
jgi:hypothetical protein